MSLYYLKHSFFQKLISKYNAIFLFYPIYSRLSCSRFQKKTAGNCRCIYIYIYMHMHAHTWAVHCQRLYRSLHSRISWTQKTKHCKWQKSLTTVPMELHNHSKSNEKPQFKNNNRDGKDMEIPVTFLIRKIVGAVSKVSWSSAASPNLGTYTQNVDFCLMPWPLWDSSLWPGINSVNLYNLFSRNGTANNVI